MNSFISRAKGNARKKRFDLFYSLMNMALPKEHVIKIIDVGGTQKYWESMMMFQEKRNIEITLVNLLKEDIVGKSKHIGIRYEARQGNILDKDFVNSLLKEEYHICYSNSVIEHLYTKQNQIGMAESVRRLATYHWIQTPYKYFPLEPHFHFPFWIYIPKPIRKKLLMNFELGHFPILSSEEASDILDEIRLISESEYRKWFPESVIWKEKTFGLTKSIVAHNFHI